MRLAIKKNYDPRNTIILTGVPRSGTTWIGEILNTLPNSAMLFEPLHLGRVPEADQAGFSWTTFLEPECDDPLKIEFMRTILTGKLINRWLARDLTLKDCRGMKTLIVKFVRAHMLIEWIVQHFPIRRPIYVIRHPCAVIASMLRLEWRNFTDKASVMGEPMLKKFPELKVLVEDLDTVEEFLAAKWCLSNYYALTRPYPRNFELIIYERMVSQRETEFQRLFKAVGYPIPDEAFSRLKSPSVTTHFGDPWKGKGPLHGWTKILNKEQTHRILNVVKAFGMDFYTEALEPDYDRLLSKTPLFKHLPKKTENAIHLV